MAKRKRAWNSSNPLYRYLQAQKGQRVSKKRGVKSMARRGRRSVRSRGSRGFGSMGGLMNGLLPMPSLAKSAIMGIGSATLADAIPIQFQFKHEAAAFLTSGIVGAGAVVAAKALTNSQNLQGGTNSLFVA